MARKHSLTAKQEHFCQLLVGGMSAADAYRLAYASDNMKPETIYQEASRLRSSPIVAQRIEQMLMEIERKMIADATRMRRHILSGLYQESINKDTGTASTRIRALELLGKVDIVGLFREPDRGRESSKDPVELQKELMSRLKRLSGVSVKNLEQEIAEDESAGEEDEEG